MSNYKSYVLFLTILFLIPFISCSTTINLPLTHVTPSPILNIYDHLNQLSKASLARAHHIKHPRSSTTKTTAATTTEIPLSPHSYGAYSINLEIGTPPQTLPFIMDTGSSFVWFPCTHKYTCAKCSFPTSSSSSHMTSPHHIPFFVPKLSSTAKLVGCMNPKCSWVHDPNTSSTTSNCTSTQLCAPYVIIYGSGTTGGLALVDTLHLNGNVKVPDFLVGCSLFSSRQPAGIAGFGRGDSSLPSQLGLAKFSYCSPSHNFDDKGVTTTLVLTSNGTTVRKLDGVSYTPLLENPRIPGMESFSEYYYVGLNKILLGGKKVKYSSNIGNYSSNNFLSPPDGVTGFGGTIVDSGTTFTYMSREVFVPLARELETQVREYKRDEVVEGLTGLWPCFDVSGVKTVSFPSLEFHFKGGAEMVFPLENYFLLAGAGETVCLTIVTDPPGGEMVPGPRVILGNFQQQNFYVEYDLKHNRFGFKHEKCN